MTHQLDINEALSNLTINMAYASRQFEEWIYSNDDMYNPSWDIENCFLQILSIAEVLNFVQLQRMILADYKYYKTRKYGFASSKLSPIDEPYSVCLSRIRQYKEAIQSFFALESNTKITKDLLQIIRDIHYVITDKKLFRNTPQTENDVHLRIEGILKCVFPDLKHKPTLTKPIKNFEPDTGISSIETLIEYKFLSSHTNVPLIADEILADTRGYTSKDWNHFLYVIYETNRFKPEREWNQLLIQSGISSNTRVIVLSGEPIKRKNKKIFRKKTA